MERDTRQRRAIRRVLEKSGNPLSTREVLVAAHRHAPTLGVATVYRNLKALVEEGWLKAVELPGEPTRYEPAGLSHHHHFRCRGCARIFDLVGNRKGGRKGCQPPGARAPKGFVVESHEILVYGRCASCAGAA